MNTVYSEARDRVGQAIADYAAEHTDPGGEVGIDWCSSHDIDPLADKILAAIWAGGSANLPKISAQFTTGADKGITGFQCVDVLKVEAQDDGTLTVTLNYWPKPEINWTTLEHKLVNVISDGSSPPKHLRSRVQKALGDFRAFQDDANTLSNAEFLSKRLARVAKLVGVAMPIGTYQQTAEVAGTVLGEIARKLETEQGEPGSFAAFVGLFPIPDGPVEDLQRGVLYRLSLGDPVAVAAYCRALWMKQAPVRDWAPNTGHLNYKALADKLPPGDYKVKGTVQWGNRQWIIKSVLTDSGHTRVGMVTFDDGPLRTVSLAVSK